MFNVIAANHEKKNCFDENFLEREYAELVFRTATQCLDCSHVLMCDAITGEIIKEWNCNGTLTFY